jgi:cation diffusion facilitator family transporter
VSARDEASAALTSRRSVERTQRTAHASRRTVLIALVANAVVALAKVVGGTVSGSAALLAEAAHSLADTTNQGFLLVSISLSEREPTPDQPFGYGRARFLWTFMAAVAMFVAGALFAIGYGIYQLLSAPESTGYAAAYVTLAVSLAAEGASWMRAVRQTRREADEAKLPLLRYVRSSRDPNVKMVLFEDTAALAGLGIAFAGILVDQLTGASIFDPLASIGVGVLLIAVAGWMAHDTLPVR